MKNSKGKIYYGMHFYPGVAEYAEPGVQPYRIFLNEDTIRSMDPTFAGRPIYVEHVDEVETQPGELVDREADGYVIESFFNQADGKHWVKFLIVSEQGDRAIQSGYRLSNAYIPKSFGQGGQWNGVSYAKEVLSAEYEHLAIVSNPRYEESVVLTPDQFKSYNDEKVVELKRLANSKEKTKEKSKMGLNIFKRQKVENEFKIDGLMVELPKSKKEMLLSEVVTQYDAVLNMNGYANGDHFVKVGEDEMSVNDLVKKHMEMCNEMEEMKKPKENGGEGEPGVDIEDEPMENDEDEKGTVEEGEKDVGDRGGDKHMNEDEESEEPKEKKKNAKKTDAEMAAIREKNKRIANAHLRDHDEEVAVVEVSADQVARGKARYGS